MNEDQLYAHLNRKYPTIIPIKGETLNIKDAINQMVIKCYNDRKKFPTIVCIMAATGLSNRTINRIVKGGVNGISRYRMCKTL